MCIWGCGSWTPAARDLQYQLAQQMGRCGQRCRSLAPAQAGTSHPDVGHIAVCSRAPGIRLLETWIPGRRCRHARPWGAEQAIILWLGSAVESQRKVCRPGVCGSLGHRSQTSNTSLRWEAIGEARPQAPTPGRQMDSQPRPSALPQRATTISPVCMESSQQGASDPPSK